MWPDVIWDPPAIRQARRVAQKPKLREEIWAWLVLRRISIYVSTVLARIPFVTPNMITIVSIVIPVVFALCLGYGYAVPPWLVFLAFNLSFFLDCVDGEVARLTGKFSTMGVWLDKLLHLALLILWLGVCLDAFLPTLGSRAHLVIMLALVNGLLGFWLTVGSEALLPASVHIPSVTLRKSSTTLDIAVFLLSSQQGFYLLYPILAALPSNGNKAIAIWVSIHLVTEALKNLWRTRTIWRLSRLASETHGSGAKECRH